MSVPSWQELLGRLQDAIAAEIAWHQAEARKHREAEADLEQEAPDDAVQNAYDAIGHEVAADRLRLILYPPPGYVLMNSTGEGDLK